jgi:hypothetical protein
MGMGFSFSWKSESARDYKFFAYHAIKHEQINSCTNKSQLHNPLQKRRINLLFDVAPKICSFQTAGDGTLQALQLVTFVPLIA